MLIGILLALGLIVGLVWYNQNRLYRWSSGAVFLASVTG